MAKKSIPAAIGGLVLLAVGAYFGVDLGDAGSGAAGSGGGDQTGGTQRASLDTCALDTLPEQADDTAEDILAGGPFEHPGKDGSRFGNREHVLPDQASNYYREYTVDTPGSSDRGARRIITGGGSEKDPQVWYYTDDHYETFCTIPDAEDADNN